jgi:hypothetical protein
MKTPSIGTLSFSAICLASVVLIAIGPPGSRYAPLPSSPAAPPSPSISAGGFTLTSTSVDLPLDEQQYPAGRGADVINANCTSCHSASMALNQPLLSSDQWRAEVTKMREVYKAPIAEPNVPVIVAYLTEMSATLREPHAPISRLPAAGGGAGANRGPG